MPRNNSQATINKRDQKVLNKRDFYLKAIQRMQKQIDDEALHQAWSLEETDERFKQLQAHCDSFQMQCMLLSAENNLDEDQIMKIEDENQAIETLCIQLKVKLRVHMEALTKPSCKATITKPPTTGEPAKVEQQSTTVTIENTWGIFTGNLSDWQAFQAKFTKAMNAHPKLSPNEKLNILKKSCAQNVETIISELSNGSYDDAWKKMNKVFGNPYKQAQLYMHKLTGIPKIQYPSSGAIRELINNANECESVFKQAMDLHNFEIPMALIVIGKMDNETRRAWERHQMALAESWAQCEEASSAVRSASSYLPTWAAVKSFLESELLIYAYEIDQSQASHGQCSYTQSKVNKQSHRKQEAFVTSVQALKQAKGDVPEYLKCKLCDGIHPLYKCDEFTSKAFDQRWIYVRSEQLCVKCLRQNHNGNCEVASCNLPCPSCAPSKVFHNSKLCGNKKDKKQSEVKPMPRKDWANEQNWDNN